MPTSWRWFRTLFNLQKPLIEIEIVMQTPVPYFLEGTHPLKKGKGMENKLSRGQEYVELEGIKMKRRN